MAVSSKKIKTDEENCLLCKLGVISIVHAVSIFNHDDDVV